MFNIIFPIIIFVSLAIIVFIIGKHLPEFVDIKKNGSGQSRKNKYFKNLIKKIFNLIKNLFLWLIDQIIKKIKNFLTLIQSSITSKNKEIVSSEVKTEQGIETTNFLEKIVKKEEAKEAAATEKTDFFEKKPKKKEILKVEKPKKSFFANFKKNLKEKILKKKRQKINQVFQEIEEDEEDNSQFSDGIVKIHEKSNNNNFQKKDLINEVIEIKKNQVDKMSLDEEIGVDRHVLEKKLINKIAQNPRDKEVYRQLGELYLKMANYGDAEGCYKQILKMAVRDIDAKRKIERIKLLKRSQRK